MRTIHVIGIGAGDPEQLTLQAVGALRSTDVFFVLDKGEAKADLVRLRREMLETHVPEGTYRIVEARDPERDRSAGGAAYSPAVGDWRSARAGIYERLIAEELDEDQSGAFLVWGDPALYDSTLGILEEILERGSVAFEYDVVPGISSVSSLVARHRTGLNRVARPVQITTGRRLAEGFPEDTDDVVVMLDAHQAFRQYADQDIDIYWGAYLGTPDEILASGPIAEAAPRIERLRAEARERKGWIMDTYLLRRNPGDR
ncbi:precorrin-6A synthase (deacetylating) [Streptomyces sp. KPB2]|uniref:precorrin-6A synthase (deacetylating) n=1 Tax=Streptomyces TaxID=1883 RepID=UPI000F70B97A|nr:MULTISPECIES: precorrin-6A synthase (deacetylating) [Streptomyces]AZM74248.1 precorrin-6A synthase (deacetylating) [Streptomyces sp. KPB2]MBH5129242.1 precorrin-6A synthase (deacetylating) [Streptomyces sp. HB-N217]WST99941.1 precorrin-6A synthase (deacetylating) [Streptomyces sp. NBC_01124]